MPNLKPYYDAALAADAEVKRILNEMDAAFNEGTEEGQTKALELRPTLDGAKVKAEQANQLYASMRDASLVNDSMAALFTTPPDPAKDEHDGTSDASPKVMKLSEFRALPPKDRLAFSKAGGKIED
jgi:hypothetical protein